jgi:hypothetical protein
VEPACVLLVHCLACHPERLRDLGPGPAVEHGALDGGVLDTVGEAPQSADCGERIGWIIGDSRRDYGLSTIVDAGLCLSTKVAEADCSSSGQPAAW